MKDQDGYFNITDDGKKERNGDLIEDE